MARLNGVGRTAIDPVDLSTFAAPPKYQVLQGPARLYRFGSSRGKWWFGPSLMDSLKEDFYEATFGTGPRQKNDDGTRFARYSLAVSQEWNKFSRISVLTLGAGDELDYFVGPAAPQPEWQTKQDGPMLSGGLLQYAVYEIAMVPSRCFQEMSTVALWKQWS